MRKMYGTLRQITDESIIRRLRSSGWITKVTNTHTHTHTRTEYIILIAFLRQQWVRERTSILLYMYIACLVVYRRCRFVGK